MDSKETEETFMLKTKTLTPFIVVCLLLGLASQAWAGIYYRAVTTTEGQRGQTVVEAWVEGPQAKIEFRDSAEPMFSEGTYLLTTNAGETLFLVNPKEKTYTEFDLEAMMGMLNSIMESTGGMFSFDIENPQVTRLLEESGPALLGYPTTHYRYKTTYDMTMKVMGMKRGNSVEMIQDAWTTDAVSAEAMGVWIRPLRPVGNEGIDRLIKEQMKAVQGFPLRSVVETTTTGEKGKRSQTTKSETVVTELAADRSIPDGTFQIPPGYEKVDLMEGMPEPQGDQEEKGGLRSLFGGGGR